MGRDFQRSRVYKWERANLFDDPRLNIKWELDHIRRLVQHFDIDVLDGRGRRRACGDPYNRIIKLPRWSRFPAVVWHEVAHVVTPPNLPGGWHGPHFVAIYIKLLNWHHDISVVNAAGSAREFGVKVDEVSLRDWFPGLR